jgi:MraZ protein
VGERGYQVAGLSQARFRGQSLHRLDAKGRLRVPAKFREVLDSHEINSMVVTSTPKYLVAYAPDAWEEVEAKATNTSQVQPYHRAFMRYYISSAEECELDKQGRILIPNILRQRVGIEQEVMLAGMLGNFEIWDKAAWEREMKWSAENFSQIAEEMASFGF